MDTIAVNSLHYRRQMHRPWPAGNACTHGTCAHVTSKRNATPNQEPEKTQPLLKGKNGSVDATLRPLALCKWCYNTQPTGGATNSCRTTNKEVYMTRSKQSWNYMYSDLYAMSRALTNSTVPFYLQQYKSVNASDKLEEAVSKLSVRRPHRTK